MTLLVMNNINLPPSKCTHKHTHIHIHTCDQMPLYPYSECNLRLLHLSISSLSVWRLLFLCSAFLSLCVTLLLHEEPQSGLIIFGLFIQLAFEPGRSVHSHTDTDVLTDVKIHSIYDTSVLIAFQPKNTPWNAVMQLLLSPPFPLFIICAIYSVLFSL